MTNVKHQLKATLRHYDAAKVSVLTRSIIEPTTQTELAAEFLEIFLGKATEETDELLLEAGYKALKLWNKVNNGKLKEHRVGSIKPDLAHDTASELIDYSKKHNNNQVQNAIDLCVTLLTHIEQDGMD